MEDSKFLSLASKFTEVAHFMGISYSTLLLAAKQSETEDLLYYFNEGLIKFLEYLDDYVTREALLLSDYTVGGISQKVESILWNRAVVHTNFRNYRSFIKARLCFAANPKNSIEALKLTFRLADSIWHATGDSSTDFSFYSKRATLIALNTAFMRKFANDYSHDFMNSRTFLRGRIKNIVTLSKTKAKLIERVGRYFGCS